MKLSRIPAALATIAGRSVRSLPGVGAVACGVAGANMLWGAGVALLVASGFLLVLARELN